MRNINGENNPNYKHGQSGSKEYRCWTAIKNRCFNTNTINYKHYGGLGITMCDEWKNSFTTFYNDVGKAPEDNYTIDRIDSKGNYEPSNVRWVDNKTGIQAINQRIRKDNTSGIKGVYWEKDKNKWRAVISTKGKRIHLGFFENKNDAIKARLEAEEKYHTPLFKKVAA